MVYAAYTLYIVAAVLVAQRLGIWNAGLLKETIAWFLLPGLVLLFGSTRLYKDRSYYRRTLIGVIGLSAAIEFYVNLAEFPLPVELLLLPALVFLAALSAVAGSNRRRGPRSGSWTPYWRSSGSRFSSGLASGSLIGSVVQQADGGPSTAQHHRPAQNWWIRARAEWPG